MSCSYQSHWTNFTYQSLHLNTFEDGAESGRGAGLCLGFQQKVLNANESFDSGEPGSETVSRFQKAPAREKEIKHKCDGDVGLCYLSFIDWNLQRKKNNNVTRSCPLYETPWSLSNPQHLCLWRSSWISYISLLFWILWFWSSKSNPTKLKSPSSFEAEGIGPTSYKAFLVPF